MTTPIASALVILGSGHPLRSVESALRSAINQLSQLSQIICIADDYQLERLSVLTAALPMTTVVDADDTQLAELAHRTGAAWIFFLEASSTLVEGSLSIAEAAASRFDIDLLYGDSRLESTPEVRRPAFSSVRLRSQYYLGPLIGVKREVLLSCAATAGIVQGAELWDIALRICEHAPKNTATRVLRIPNVLTTDGSVAARDLEAARMAVVGHLHRMGIPAIVGEHNNGCFAVQYPLANDPLVSIIIPTRGSSAVIRGRQSILVIDAIRSILEKSTYEQFEIVIVADDTTAQTVIDELRALAKDRLRLVHFAGEFNFSAKMNRGAVHAAGDYLLLLNDDVEVITSDWIETMLGLAAQPEIGLVGTLLYFEDGSVQHAGHLYGGGWAGHIAAKWAPGRTDALNSLTVDREVSGVTAACAMISADLFWRIGGFSIDYAGNYNDVDFAFKVREFGRSIVCTPRASLFHFESKSRIAAILPSELATIRSRWGSRMLSDPYWRD